MANASATPENVARAAAGLGRVLNEPQALGLSRYLGLLETWNRKINLVGPGRWPEMLSDLAADSWHLADLLDREVAADWPLTLDYGAGAGIPGLPLRLFWPAGRYCLIEPRAKRAGFLRQCLAVMGLEDTWVFEGRCEALTLPEGRAAADVCLSRAFKPWREFLETVRPVFGPGSLAVVFAGESEPAGEIPSGFALHAAASYPSRGKTGWFWVFRSTDG